MYAKGRARQKKERLPCLHERLPFFLSGERSELQTKGLKALSVKAGKNRRFESPAREGREEPKV